MSIVFETRVFENKIRMDLSSFRDFDPRRIYDDDFSTSYVVVHDNNPTYVNDFHDSSTRPPGYVTDNLMDTIQLTWLQFGIRVGNRISLLVSYFFTVKF